MKKMIIKNCPLYIQDTEECAEYFDFRMCKDITDCLLKRIADICCYASPDGGFNDSEAQDLANGIIGLLEIEDAEWLKAKKK